MIDKAAHNKAKPAMTPDQLVPIAQDELEGLKKEFGIQLYADAAKLNGGSYVI